MLRLNKIQSNRGQGIMSEYGLIFIIVVGMVTAMTVYVKRVIQARIFDARNYMVTLDVINNCGGIRRYSIEIQVTEFVKADAWFY